MKRALLILLLLPILSQAQPISRTRGGTGPWLSADTLLVLTSRGTLSPTWRTVPASNTRDTLTGDVTGNGYGSFATTIGSQKVTAAMLKDTNVTYLKLQHNSLANYLLGSTTAYHDVQPIKLGAGLTMSHDTLSAPTGGSGTVTSVALSGANGIAILSGSPVTSAGTIALGITNGSIADSSLKSAYLKVANNLSDVANANTSLNALLPSQGGNSGKFLTTNGSNSSWGTPAGGGGGALAAEQSSPSNPAGIASATLVMLGLAGSFTARDTQAVIFISGDFHNASGPGNGIQYQIAYGTGAAPANNAAPVGTTPPAPVLYSPTTPQIIPFSTQWWAHPLVINTTYWVDLQASALATQTVDFNDITITVLK